MQHLRNNRVIGFVIVLMMLIVAIVPLTFNAQGASVEPQSTQLQTLIRTAISSRNYAITTVNFAMDQRLSVSGSQTLLASGNASLAASQSDLSSDSNLTDGIQLAQIAMSDFTKAATSASLSLQNSTNTFLQISASLDSISASNNTSTQLSSTISLACAANPTNSSYNSQFKKYCTSGITYIGLATADLKQASLLLLPSETGMSAAGISHAQNLIEYANGNISLAATVVSQLAQLSYSQRVQQYITGPLAQSLSIANSTVSAQTNLVSSFSSALASYQSFSSQQSSVINSVEFGASAASVSASSATTAINVVSYDAASEQTTLSQASSDMTQLYSLILGLSSLPTLTQLQTDISNVEAAISSSSTSSAGLESQPGSFSQVTLNSLSVYSTTFQTAVNTAGSNNNELLTSVSSIQADINSAVTNYPLIASALVPWQSTLSTLYQSLSSSASTLVSDSQTATTGLASLATSSNSLQSTLYSSNIEVSSALESSVSSIYSSEGQYLNATALAKLQSSLTSILSISHMATSFVSSANSLFSVSMSGLSNAVQMLSSSGSSLETQAASTSSVMTTASIYLSSDLRVRSQALASANQDISQALVMFGDLQISQGVSLLSQASLQTQIASEAG